jgi:pilus assembly protein CpaE
MKIVAISPNKAHLRDIQTVLEGGRHSIVCLDGGKSRMAAAAQSEQPDLILVDGMCCDPSELAQVEHVINQHPRLAVILLCPMHTPEFLIHSMRAGVREVLPSPASPDALMGAVQRVANKLEGASAGRAAGKMLAFMPCKGGSGATFLATNLGWLLAETSTVLIIDLNLQFGDALSFLHDGKAPTNLATLAKNIDRLDASLLSASAVRIAPNYSVLAAPDDPGHAAEVKPEHFDAILAVGLANYDFVILDLGRNLDPLSIHAMDRAHKIYPVLQGGVPDMRNASKLLEAFRSLAYPQDKVELIVNRFEKGGAISLDQMQRTFGSVKLHTVPNSYRDVTAAINHGEPLTKTSRTSAISRILADLAKSLRPTEEQQRGLLGRLFRRA